MMDTSLFTALSLITAERDTVSLPVYWAWGEEKKERRERLLPLIWGGGGVFWASGGSQFLLEPHRSCLGSDTNDWPVVAAVPQWLHHLLLLDTERRPQLLSAGSGPGGDLDQLIAEWQDETSKLQERFLFLVTIHPCGQWAQTAGRHGVQTGAYSPQRISWFMYLRLKKTNFNFFIINCLNFKGRPDKFTLFYVL